MSIEQGKLLRDGLLNDLSGSKLRFSFEVV